MKHKLDAIFKPKSVAVIGATGRKGSIGRETLHNILLAEYNGKVFPVNPKSQVIHSIKAYSTILDVPDSVDLAIIIVPKEYVAEVVRQCGEKGVKGIVVITAGFSETGKEGEKREKEVLRIVHEYGMSMIGPNCFGIVNTDSNVNLNATFGKTYPRQGRIGFITQSGAMGEAIMNTAKELGIGFSVVASIGNKADISSNDILEYFENDPNTDIILMYLENFGNPQKFTQIARSISLKKPIVVVKSGRTSLGAKAASSHTGALAGLDVGVDALFEQTGVMRVDTVEELFDVASALANQPVPKGNKVCVVTNAGGPGILATDALINNGMEMPSFSPATVKTLKKFISAEASFSNPMDMVAGAGAKEFKLTLQAVLKDKRYDTIIPIFVPPVTINQLEVAKNIYEAVKDSNKTILACFMGAGFGSEGIAFLKEHDIPVYIFPEAIARTLATISTYNNWLKSPRGKFKNFKVDSQKVKSIIEKAQSEKLDAIVGEDAIEILKAYGIQSAGYSYASTANEAAAISSKLGYPVVMKINTPQILHKTEFGAVIVDIRNEDEVKKEFNALKKKIAKRYPNESFSVSIQEMIMGGIETVIGMTIDSSFGPLIMFGLGGIYVEIMKDVSFKIHPLTDVQAKDMVQSLKSYPLLTGFRGSEAVDLKTLQETILRVSQLVKDFEEFIEIDINPFIVSPKKDNCKAVDARFILKN